MFSFFKNKENGKSLYQLFSYAFVGGLNFIIDILILNFFWYITGMYSGNINYLFKFISFLVYSTTGYFLNRKITFKTQKSLKAYFSYISLLGVLSFIDAVIISNFTTITFSFIPKVLWSNICVFFASVSTGILGFVINKFIIFKNKSKTY